MKAQKQGLGDILDDDKFHLKEVEIMKERMVEDQVDASFLISQTLTTKSTH